MFLETIDGDPDLNILNISILPSDQCATEEERAAKCCCGDGYFFDFARRKCALSENVGFMFTRLNNSWTHMVVYGFAYPMILLMLIAPLCAVMLGMGKRMDKQKDNDRRLPNPLHQMIWLLAICGWISLLCPLPFSIWFYIIGDGTRTFNQSISMCHLFRTTMEALPHTVDTMMTLFNVLLAAARFLTQYHRNTLKLRTVERFSTMIWTIIFVCIAIGILRFLEHDAVVYQFCLDTDPGPHWAQRCMVRDGALSQWISPRFWKVTLPLMEFVVQFVGPGSMLIALHIGFVREPVVDVGDRHNRFGRSPRAQTRILITAVTIAFLMVQLPTALATTLGFLLAQFKTNRLLSMLAVLFAHLQPFLSVTTITANCGAMLTAYYVIVKDDDEAVGDSRAGSTSSMEMLNEALLREQRRRRSTKHQFLSASHSFDTASLYSYSRRGSEFPQEALAQFRREQSTTASP